MRVENCKKVPYSLFTKYQLALMPFILTYAASYQLTAVLFRGEAGEYPDKQRGHHDVSPLQDRGRV